MVEPTGGKRKLAVILVEDAEGFTRLLREAEEPTLQTLTEYRTIIDGLIGRHDGRVFGTGGDSVLAEFGSAVEPVRCALSIQEELAVRNAELSDDRKLRFLCPTSADEFVGRQALKGLQALGEIVLWLEQFLPFTSGFRGGESRPSDVSTFGFGASRRGGGDRRLVTGPIHQYSVPHG